MVPCLSERTYAFKFEYYISTNMCHGGRITNSVTGRSISRIWKLRVDEMSNTGGSAGIGFMWDDVFFGCLAAVAE